VRRPIVSDQFVEPQELMMKKFKRILVYVDTHSPVPQVALKWAAALGKPGNASIELLDVLDDLPWYVASRGVTKDDVYQALTTQKAARLEREGDKLRRNGLRVRTQVLRGKPFAEIIREVLRGRHDLVLKTVMGDGALGGASVGNAGIRLVRKCPCPVLLVRQKTRFSLRRIVAAIDPAPSDEDRNQMSAKVIDTGRGLAKLVAGQCTAVHAWMAQLETMLAGELSGDRLGPYTSRLDVDVQEFLSGFFEPFSKGEGGVELRLLKGDPRDAVPRFLSRAKSDLLVMGTVSRGGIPGLLVGNTAETLIHRAPCSVLIIKPDGFVTSVRP
jgi:universal stress protein E